MNLNDVPQLPNQKNLEQLPQAQLVDMVLNCGAEQDRGKNVARNIEMVGMGHRHAPLSGGGATVRLQRLRKLL